MIDLNGKKVFVSGGSSMIGRAICKSLVDYGAEVLSPSHDECNLLNADDVYQYFSSYKPDYVIHAAGWNGGIEWNKKYPSTIFSKTVNMGMNILDSIGHYNRLRKDHQIKKCVGILASCAYPDKGWDILEEKNLWEGLPNPSVECHGLAKRVLDAYSRQLSKQTDLVAVNCVLTNCYGPYDSFHPEKTKVVGALIRRFVEAKQQGLESVSCWGSGKPLREFMYSEDAGEAIVQTLIKYDDPSLPLNIGSSQEVSIKRLTEMIVDIVGYKGNIFWDTEKQDGQMRKLLRTARMREMLDVCITILEVGLDKTIRWYLENKDEADNKRVKL